MKKDMIKKLVLGVLFILYWVFTILDLCNGNYTDQEKKSNLIFQLMIYLPLTLCLVVSFGPMGILLLIIYQLLNTLVGFFSSFSVIMNLKKEYIVDLILGAFQIALGIICIIKLIALLRNQEKNLKLPIIILSIIVIILSILSFASSTEIEKLGIYQLLGNNILVMQVCLYVVFFPKKEIHVFKDDN